MSPPPRTFSEEDAHAIFARAAERQEALRRADAEARSGLTLEDLKRIGAEAGIAPELVAAAAAERSAQPGERPEGGSFRRVLGVPLDDTVWEGLVLALRDEFGTRGQASGVGRLHEWAFVDGWLSGEVRVTARPLPGDRTELTLDAPTASARAGGYAAAAIPAFLLAFSFFTTWPLGTKAAIVALTSLMLALTLALTLRGVPRRVQGHHRRLNAAADRAELDALRAQPSASLKTESPSPEGLAPAPSASGPALGLDALPDAPAPQDARAPHSRDRA